MDETKTVKRLVNLTDEEAEELESRQGEYMPLMKGLISIYDNFENLKVKEGRLATLHDNWVYKINFSYGELYGIANRLNDAIQKAKEKGAVVNEKLEKEVEEYLSDNSSRKVYRS